MQHTVEEVHLSNGSSGLLIDIPGATVMDCQFQFRAGSRYVRSKEKYETAHIMEHMAFGANSKFNNEQAFEADFTKNGAYHNAFTSDVSMCYVSECADFEWQRILELQGLSISEPKFKESELVSEKGNVKNELTGYQNDYSRLVWPKVQQMLGEDVLSYGQRLKTISNITLSDIRKHHSTTHTSDNLRFVIAGKLKGRKSQIKSMLESWRLNRGSRFEVAKDGLKASVPSLIRRKDARNLTFVWSSAIPRELSDAEDDAMDCLNHILTGTMNSRIFGQARKNGLVYGISSYANTGFYDSAWDFEGQVNYETASDLFRIINKEMKSVVNGDLKETELEAAKSYALGSHQMGAQTVSQINSFYAGRYFFDGKIKNYNKVPEVIKKVSLDRVVSVAREFMASSSWAFAAVGDCDKQDVNELGDLLGNIYQKEG